MIPRYITRVGELSDMPTYEFPIQSNQRTKPVATLVVETNEGFRMALAKALEWASGFSGKVGLPMYPKVYASRKHTPWLVTRMSPSGTAWIEKPNGGRGMWSPVEMLSL